MGAKESGPAATSALRRFEGGDRLHPELRQVLEAAAGFPPIHSLPVETSRTGLAARYGGLPKVAVASVEDRTIMTAGRSVPGRLYRPACPAARPLVVFLHGGGFVLGGLESHDALCRQLCNRLAYPVLSVDYALAPEHKFPAAVDDCAAAIGWAIDNAHALGGDRVVLAGDSAGANLALVSALLLKAKGLSVSALALAYPVTDAPDPTRRSYVERGEGYGLTAQSMRWFFELYLNDPAEATDPRVSPLRSELGGLAPTYVLTAEFDPLRDEGFELADKLARSGVDVTHVHQRDANHGFLAWAGTNSPSALAIDMVCEWLSQKIP
ncbi:alpha/beta hydrolase [Mesorhizobium sp. M7A.F.Ca.US.006.01.1.1]|uniref:alpha/beta hydrolase n=1 Tax=Mesorhizobium sp. M7A.F.Ca.US.006.01.1.1 TaxID=2496707 RepID=UPI000FCBDCDC|nr:alpha/beta hydrolase [Mesorhizobium sp. M7A.F.Ca.US.006.01.1.1]RUZ77975.1 alpha/beta hydrolase [Mesorhizobium sp. M7A.F.Ca.US.006.01.1.1]